MVVSEVQARLMSTKNKTQSMAIFSLWNSPSPNQVTFKNRNFPRRFVITASASWLSYSFVVSLQKTDQGWPCLVSKTWWDWTSLEQKTFTETSICTCQWSLSGNKYRPYVLSGLKMKTRTDQLFKCLSLLLLGCCAHALKFIIVQFYDDLMSLRF